MLSVYLICVGKLKEKFYQEACAEYVKRLSRFCKLELVELPEERLPEENKSVLLYMKSRSSSGTCIQTGSIDKGFWFTQSYPGFQGLANREFHVMAWMPLPEPYTEEKE